MTTEQTAALPATAPGWRVRSVSRRRGLAGANGMRLGPDGALYVASAFGGEVARVETATGACTIISSLGGGIVSPDDIAFGDHTMYVAECMNARVTAWDNGTTTIVAEDLLGANGIDVFRGRMFVDQFLPAGKLWEVFLDGRPRRLLADGLSGPNGLCASPDGYVYFVQVFTGDVMRVPMDGGSVERVVGGLSAPSSVRLGPEGLIYVSQGGSGQVSTIDPRTREVREVGRARPGIDNLAIDREGRVFISYYIDGAVYELTARGQPRELIPPGLLGPYGIAAASTGVHIADGLATARLEPDGEVSATGKFTDEGFPGYLRGLAATEGGWLLATTSEGRVARYDPVGVRSDRFAGSLSEPMGVAAGAGGAAVVAEAGEGRVVSVEPSGATTVLADGFERPVGVALDSDGGVFVSDEARGTIEHVGARRRVLAEGLHHPHDICLTARGLVVVEAAAGRLLLVAAEGGALQAIASDLPVGTGDGVRETLGGLPEMIPGPISPFAGVDVDPDGCLYVAGDADGVVMVFEPRSNG